MDPLKSQQALIDAFARRLQAADGDVAEFETHISRVLVAGGFAYKFKKALRLPFLDFSKLESRRFFCMEECRLNRRLAPQIYVDVLALTGSTAEPVPGGKGEAIEYAVRMRAFEQEALWTYRAQHDLLGAADIDGLASRIAKFHLEAPIAPPESRWGTMQAIAARSDETLAGLAELAVAEADRTRVGELRDWEGRTRPGLASVIHERRKRGMVRECHGDLHCGNILTIDGNVQVFDCIEFNDELRWIDVMNDLAFVFMDLAFRQRFALAARLLNGYLALTGDYAGLAVLRYYETHRALVRSKVMLMRAAQAGTDARLRDECRREGLAYLAFADRRRHPPERALMITHGLSGSGKSTFAQQVIELTGAVRLRSDVERKRLHGLAATDRTDGDGTAQLYGADATRRTYERLLALAHDALAAGWPVVVDAAFLRAAQRRDFSALAAALGVPFLIFDLHASEATMRSRIAARQAEGRDASDADIAVFERQRIADEALDATESAHAVAVDMESRKDAARAAGTLAAANAILSRLRDRPPVA